jgi:hypothetical protein
MRRLLVIPNLALPLFSFVLCCFTVYAQDSEKRGRKYTPPPDTAHLTVSVVKDANGKPVENAAVVFHMVGEEGKGNMEMKTNEEGKAVIDVIPIGDTVRLQVIAQGFQTFGEDYKVNSDSKDIVVRLKHPVRQYSTYEHTTQAESGSGSGQSSGKPPSDTQTPQKR